jgi:hypothetical protein
LHPCKQLVDSEYLGTLTSNDLKNWNPDTDEQIMYQGASPQGICEYHGLHRSNLVEAAVNAKRTSRYCSIKRDLNMGCCGVKKSGWHEFSGDEFNSHEEGSYRYHSILEPC